MPSSPPLYIVTGATRGIGRSVAIALATAGFRVAAIGRSAQLLDSLKSMCGPSLIAIEADLTSQTGIDLVARNVAAKPDIAGIVHCAGSLVRLEPYETIDPNQLTDHFRIHVTAPISLFQTLSRSHRIRRMLFVDSYSASTPRDGWAAYSIVKAAAQMSARCAAQELSHTICVRVFPGAVKTRIVDTVLESDTPTAATFRGMIKAGQFVDATEASCFITKLMVQASDDLLTSQESFDYNNPTDLETIRGL